MKGIFSSWIAVRENKEMWCQNVRVMVAIHCRDWNGCIRKENGELQREVQILAIGKWMWMPGRQLIKLQKWFVCFFADSWPSVHQLWWSGRNIRPWRYLNTQKKQQKQKNNSKYTVHIPAAGQLSVSPVCPVSAKQHTASWFVCIT